MSDDRHNKNSDDGPVFWAEQARQGEIILRKRTRRIISIAGLVGIVILAYALLRWFDKPLRAWLTSKYADPVRVPAGAAQANV